MSVSRGGQHELRDHHAESERYDNLGEVTNLVKICHADGTVSRYLHLMKDSTGHLEIGQRVGDARRGRQRIRSRCHERVARA